MSKDVKNIFENIDFDIYEPPKGHQKRFELKLKKKKQNNKSWIGIAASIILLIGLTFTNIIEKNNDFKLSKLSPKMAETESFFMSTITQELKEVEKYRSFIPTYTHLMKISNNDYRRQEIQHLHHRFIYQTE